MWNSRNFSDMAEVMMGGKQNYYTARRKETARESMLGSL